MALALMCAAGLRCRPHDCLHRVCVPASRRAPMLLTTCKAGLGCKQLLVAGQKSGIVWALRPDTGAVDWWTQAGPGGVIGGMMWGSATDGQRVYAATNNYFHLPLDLVAMKAVPNQPGAATPPASANGGALITMDAWTGATLWCVCVCVCVFAHAYVCVCVCVCVCARPHALQAIWEV